jgi:hypothetical protein
MGAGLRFLSLCLSSSPGCLFLFLLLSSVSSAYPGLLSLVDYSVAQEVLTVPTANITPELCDKEQVCSFPLSFPPSLSFSSLPVF